MTKWYEIHCEPYLWPWPHLGPNRKEFKTDEEAISMAKKIYGDDDHAWQVVRCEVIFTAKA
jgi:hypothetical protein